MKIPHILLAIFASCAIAAAQQPATQAPASTPAARPTPAPAPIPDGVELLHDVVTGHGGTRELHAEIIRPKNPPSGLMPAVIWVHGGGWSGGTHKQINFACFLATKGYLVASIEYRLSTEAPWPAQIEDCKLGVRWLRANAATYHIDPDRIGCWGVSAGGHLVACLGTMGDQPTFEGTGGYPGISSKVQAVADFCGPADFNTGDFVPRLAQIVDKFIGATFADRPDLWKQASPVNYVAANDPPFLIVHGDKDATVPIAQAESLVAALKAAGVSVQYLRVEGGGHGFVLGSTAYPEKVLTFFDSTLRK